MGRQYQLKVLCAESIFLAALVVQNALLVLWGSGTDHLVDDGELFVELGLAGKDLVDTIEYLFDFRIFAAGHFDQRTLLFGQLSHHVVVDLLCISVEIKKRLD